MFGTCRRGGLRWVQAVSYRARTTETQGSGLWAPDGSLAACRTEVFAGVTNHRYDADFSCRIGPIRESTDLAKSWVGRWKDIENLSGCREVVSSGDCWSTRPGRT